MTLTDFATRLTARVRAEGANCFAITVALHLTAIARTYARPTDIDSEVHTGLAAITTLLRGAAPKLLGYSSRRDTAVVLRGYRSFYFGSGQPAARTSARRWLGDTCF